MSDEPNDRPIESPGLGELFRKARELSPSDRDPWLADLDDPEVADLLRRLLKGHERARVEGFLDIPDGGEGLVDPDPTPEFLGRSAHPAGTPADTGRFRKLRAHAEGGLGIVSVARDEELRREVALKEIRPDLADRDDLRARFLVEAEINGNLEHPGIVPVYGLGHGPDGRPYYAMRLIQGDTLRTVVDRFHEADAKPRDPGDRAVELRRLLARFLDVCNTIGYAHSRGVIHRDLKPANIMVGKYGETLVVDWGLAKSIGKPGDDPDATGEEGTLVPGSGSGLQPTEIGTRLGTPAYMSPEQAGGRLDLQGPLGDIYSLGATLYYLLTGRVAFPKGEQAEQLRMVERGEFPPPRSVNPRVDPALDAICRKAMAREPGDRYPTCRALAEDVERWLADEPVTAYRETWTSRARRWTKNHRTAVTSAAATLVVALAALTVGLIVVGGLYRQLDISLGKEKTARNLAEDRKKIADENFVFAFDAIKAQVLDIDHQLRNHPGTRDLREKLQKGATNRLKTLTKRADGRTNVDQAAMFAHNNLGDIFLQIDRKPTLARDQYQMAYEIAKKLWEANPTDAQARRDIAYSYERMGGLSLQAAETEKAKEYYAKDLDIREALVRADPDDIQARRELAISYSKLGDALFQAGETARSLEFFTKALGVREALAKAAPNNTQARRDLAVVYDSLGNVLRRTGETAKAQAQYRKGLDIFEARAKADPNDAMALRDLAVSYSFIGDLLYHAEETAESLVFCTKALGVCEALAKIDPNDARAKFNLSASYVSLGNVLLQARDTIRAREFFTKALGVCEPLAKIDPDDTQVRRMLADCYLRLGDVSLQVGERVKAREFYRQSVDVSEALVVADPKDTSLQHDLAISYSKLGDLSREEGKMAEASESYKKGLTLRERMANGDRDNAGHWSDLANLYERLAYMAIETEGLAKALEFCEKGLTIRERLARDHADEPDFRSDVGRSLNNMALIDLREKRFSAAREKLKRAIAEQKKALAIRPNHPTYREGLMGHLNNLIDADRGLADAAGVAEAEEELAKLRDSDPAMAALDARLAAIIKGEQRPIDEADRLRLARRAYDRALHATATRLWAEALATTPRLGDDREAQHRYNAACAATLASAGRGKDDPRPDEAARARLRAQALGWLKAELSAWRRVAMTIGPGNKELVAQTLARWKGDADLAGVREPSALDVLPEDERRDWRAFWAEVEGLLAKTTPK